MATVLGSNSFLPMATLPGAGTGFGANMFGLENVAPGGLAQIANDRAVAEMMGGLTVPPRSLGNNPAVAFASETFGGLTTSRGDSKLETLQTLGASWISRGILSEREQLDLLKRTIGKFYTDDWARRHVEIAGYCRLETSSAIVRSLAWEIDHNDASDMLPVKVLAAVYDKVPEAKSVIDRIEEAASQRIISGEESYTSFRTLMAIACQKGDAAKVITAFEAAPDLRKVALNLEYISRQKLEGAEVVWSQFATALKPNEDAWRTAFANEDNLKEGSYKALLDFLKFLGAHGASWATELHRNYSAKYIRIIAGAVNRIVPDGFKYKAEAMKELEAGNFEAGIRALTGSLYHHEVTFGAPLFIFLHIIAGQVQAAKAAIEEFCGEGFKAYGCPLAVDLRRHINSFFNCSAAASEAKPAFIAIATLIKEVTKEIILEQKG